MIKNFAKASMRKDLLTADVMLTSEQQAIIDFIPCGQDVIITALAGTGKTSTLKFVADAYPLRQGLYLAFNKALQLDAMRKFPPYITCMTIHSLAYRHMGLQYSSQLNHKLHNSNVINFLGLNDLRYKGHYLSTSLLAASIKDMISAFCNSTALIIDQTHYSQHMLGIAQAMFQTPITNLLDDQQPVGALKFLIEESLRHAPQLWQAMCDVDNHVIPASHDTYLKLYQLSQPQITGFDYIMLDEAQDANPAIIDILHLQNVQKIFVGDRNQQIYEFRGAINAMNMLQGQEFHLTQSFRFGPLIATYANHVLDTLHETMQLKGYNLIKSVLKPVDTTKPYALIARTNAALFDSILTAGIDGFKVFFVGGIDRTISLFESAYYLKIDRCHYIKDISIRHFNSWQKFKDEAWLSSDHEYAAMITFIETHGDSTLENLAIIRDTCCSDENYAHITMTTAHRAKGRQWPQVKLLGDFLPTEDVQEKHVYYVAVTRAELVLECPANISLVKHDGKDTVELGLKLSRHAEPLSPITAKHSNRDKKKLNITKSQFSLINRIIKRLLN